MGSIEEAAIAKVEKIKSRPFYEENMYNRFTDIIYRLHDACYINKPKDYIIKGKTVSVNTEKYFILEEAEHLIRDLANESPDIDVLYEFAIFVKYMEKVFFYKNDKDAIICCDSTLEEKTRKLVFNSKELQIITTIDLDKNMVDVVISRNYGRNMKNGYTIINRKVDFEGKSDLVLMNNITLIMQNLISNFVFKVVLLIANNNLEFAPFQINSYNKDLDNLNIYDYIHDYHISRFDPVNCRFDFTNKSEEYKNILYLLKKHIIP